MKAITVKEPGGTEQLQIVEHEKPIPKDENIGKIIVKGK